MRDNKKVVMIVDDERKITRGISDFLRAKGFEPIEAYDGESAVERCFSDGADIDLIILDVMLPKQDGYSVLRELRGNGFKTPVILLTAKSEEWDQVKGFECGADDFVTKPFSPTVLLARVEAILRRSDKLSTGELQVGELMVDTSMRRIFAKGKELKLTRREYDLLLYLMCNPTIALTREQLLDSVWGYDFEGGTRTVDTHIKQLRYKLGPDLDYIKTAHCVGYRFEVVDENENEN